MVLWTTKYIDAAVAQLRADGHEIWTTTSRACRRSSTRTSRCWAATATPRPPRPGRSLRPLRDPDSPGLDDDEHADGVEDWHWGPAPAAQPMCESAAIQEPARAEQAGTALHRGNAYAFKVGTQLRQPGVHRVDA